MIDHEALGHSQDDLKELNRSQIRNHGLEKSSAAAG